MFHLKNLALKSYQFSGAMKGSTEDEVRLQALHSRDLEPLLEFIYGTALEVNGKNLMEILGVAEYLQVESAMELCVQYMESTLRKIV